MAALVVELLDRHLALERLGDPDAVLGDDVPVVERVRHERRGLDVRELVELVAAGPEVVVVAGGPVLADLHEALADRVDAVLPPRRVAAVDVVEQVVDVLADPAAGVPDHPVRAVVVVVGGVRRDRDDRLEALDAGRRGGDRQRAVVRRAGHADLARRPVGRDLGGAVDRRVALRPPVEPVDDRLGAVILVRAADRRAALRQARARRLRVDDGEAARHPRVHFAGRDRGPVRVPGDRRRGGARRWRRAELVIRVPEVLRVRRGRARVVRARLVDHRHLQVLAVGLGRPGDVDVHAVALAVAVRVELRLDPQPVPDPLGRDVEGRDDLRLAVHEDRLRLRHRRRGERGGKRERDRDHDRTTSSPLHDPSRHAAALLETGARPHQVDRTPAAERSHPTVVGMPAPAQRRSSQPRDVE